MLDCVARAKENESTSYDSKKRIVESETGRWQNSRWPWATHQCWHKYYGLAIRWNSHKLQEMKKAVWA